MKKVLTVAALIAFGVGGVWLFKKNNSAPQAPATKPAAVSPADASAPPLPGNSSDALPVPSESSETASPGSLAGQDLASKSPALEVSSLPPTTVLDAARVVIKNYGTTFGGNPVGTNAEITEALLGKNPKGITFLVADTGLRVNENGEMVDAFGTPFFFHQVSGKQMEIRSAGQDRKLWTFDDLITR